MYLAARETMPLLDEELLRGFHTFDTAHLT